MDSWVSMRLTDTRVGGSPEQGVACLRIAAGRGHLCWESQAELLRWPLCRTLDMASSVTSFHLFGMAGRWRMAPRLHCQASLSVRQGLGPASAGACLPSCTRLSLLALWNSPAALDKRQQNKLPPTKSCTALPPPVHTKPVLHAHRLSGQLRAQTLQCWVWRSSWAPVSFPLTALSGCHEGNCLRLALASQGRWVQRPWAFNHERTQGCCLRGAPLEQCR